MFLRASLNVLWLVRISLAALVNISALRTCTAQALYGTLAGDVTDASGAGMPQATVTILHKETSRTRQTTTVSESVVGMLARPMIARAAARPAPEVGNGPRG
jgi:hypothetical protein